MWCQSVLYIHLFLSSRKLDVTNMTLHFSGVGAHAKVFESLSSMLSRNALNPADVSSVREY